MVKDSMALRVLCAAALASLVSAQYPPNFTPAWTASWPSNSQAAPVAFNNAWLADFNTIVFNGTALAPIVASSAIGQANANYCDWSYNLCNGTNDIYQCSAPMQWGLSFDDGPLEPQSSALYAFLKSSGVHATHYMIGTNIVQFPQLLWEAFQNGDQIAVHTWTHHAMTTLDSKTAYAELRYPIEIIKNITGMTPIHWRPPYGDVDDRIRAIAKHLNLTTNLWNQDTNDWCIGDANPTADGCPTGFTADSVHLNLEAWAVNQKTNPHGLVVLEHELSNGSVSQFMEAFPTMKANGWDFMAVATCNNVQFYAESVANTTTSVPVSSTPPTASVTGSGAGAGVPANGTGAAAATTAAAKSAAAALHYGAASAIVLFVAAAYQLLF